MKAKRLSEAQQSDLITTLPQAVIEAILCLLPIEEAARTSILSREWRHKWTTIPKLTFCLSTVKRPSEMEQPGWWMHVSTSKYLRLHKALRCKLFCAIHQVMLLRQGPIHEFILSMDAQDTCFEIDQIIHHLSRNHAVKKLTFYFHDPSSYSLPLSFFSSLHHLTDLVLGCCIINHKPTFNGFGSLTRLSLSHTRISKESLLHLLLNCPSLKWLNLGLPEKDFLSDEKPSMMELFKCLPVIEHLKTRAYIIRFKSLAQASVPKELPASLIHLKYVCIRQMCFVNGYGLHSLLVLTKCCPNLEKLKLVIDNDWENENDVESDVMEECFMKLEEYSDVWLEHMKELKIDFLRNIMPELEFVKFVMARSPTLKKVTLLPSMVDKNTELEMLKVLLSSPCSSPVEIVVRSR